MSSPPLRPRASSSSQSDASRQLRVWGAAETSALRRRTRGCRERVAGLRIHCRSSSPRLTTPSHVPHRVRSPPSTRAHCQSCRRVRMPLTRVRASRSRSSTSSNTDRAHSSRYRRTGTPRPRPRCVPRYCASSRWGARSRAKAQTCARSSVSGTPSSPAPCVTTRLSRMWRGSTSGSSPTSPSNCTRCSQVTSRTLQASSSPLEVAGTATLPSRASSRCSTSRRCTATTGRSRCS
mmetsp:Transcript_13869/g.35954  ORF Transcript_13869/g.35954 Transcript_13869/m.35954 type:complete len:235 (+) Transcript_13869:123-827(+)